MGLALRNPGAAAPGSRPPPGPPPAGRGSSGGCKCGARPLRAAAQPGRLAQLPVYAFTRCTSVTTSGCSSSACRGDDKPEAAEFLDVVTLHLVVVLVGVEVQRMAMLSECLLAVQVSRHA